MARGKWWEYLIPGHNVGLMVGDVYDGITGNSEKNAGTGVFGTRKNGSNSYQYAQSNDRVTTAKNNLDYWKGQQPEDTTGQYDSQISGTQSQLDKMNRDGFPTITPRTRLTSSTRTSTPGVRSWPARTLPPTLRPVAAATATAGALPAGRRPTRAP